VLAKALLDAAVVFRRCIEQEPGDVDHWAWYVASMLGALCISFGSSLSTNPHGKLKAEGDEKTLTARLQLGCFHEVQNNSSVALTDFLKFTENHDCSMFHLAVVSMLEWKKAVLLLHRPTNANVVFGVQVKQVHAYHVSNFSWWLSVEFVQLCVIAKCLACVFVTDVSLGN